MWLICYTGRLKGHVLCARSLTAAVGFVGIYCECCCLVGDRGCRGEGLTQPHRPNRRLFFCKVGGLC